MDPFVPIRGKEIIVYLIKNPVALMISPVLLLAIFIGPAKEKEPYLFWDQFDD